MNTAKKQPQYKPYDKRKIVTWLDDETYDDFRKLCAEEGLSQAALIRHAIKQRVNARKREMAGAA